MRPDDDEIMDAALFGQLFGADLAPLEEDDNTELLDDRSVGLDEVSGRIAGQYAEIIGRFGARAFAGTGTAADMDALKDAVIALRRLSAAVCAHRQVELLDELRSLVEGIAGRRGERRRALSRLQLWIPEFAETLPDDQGKALRELVDYDPGSIPLLDELRNIRGVGRRRLQRLYAAGLFTIESVATASPKDIADVTGIPLGLSEKIIAATRDYADQERERCIKAFREQASRLVSFLRSASGDPKQIALLDAVQVLEQVSQVLEQTSEGATSAAPQGDR